LQKLSRLNSYNHMICRCGTSSFFNSFIISPASFTKWISCSADLPCFIIPPSPAFAAESKAAY
jgi:hypothetical protein